MIGFQWHYSMWINISNKQQLSQNVRDWNLSILIHPRLHHPQIKSKWWIQIWPWDDLFMKLITKIVKSALLISIMEMLNVIFWDWMKMNQNLLNHVDLQSYFNHVTSSKRVNTLICHTTIHRNSINFLYNPSHIPFDVWK